MYAERWGLEPCTLPVVVNVASAPCDTLDFSPLDESSSLIFYNVSKHARSGQLGKARVLQAGTPLGLMAYLYSRCSRQWPAPRWAGASAPAGATGRSRERWGEPWPASVMAARFHVPETPPRASS